MRSFGCVVVALALSCQSSTQAVDETDAPPDSDGVTSPDEPDPREVEDEDETEDATGETDDAPDEPAPPAEDVPPPPATGIQIAHVTADQGVRIPVARDGALVSGSARNLPILRQRALVLRGFYELDPAFVDRDIYGELTVRQADGSERTYGSFINVRARDCSGLDPLDCHYALMPYTFYWRIPPDEVNPGMTYRIELLETAPGHEDVQSDKIPVFPIDGGALALGVEDSYMKMRVVLVPVHHDLGASCPEAPDLMEEHGPSIDGDPLTVADFFGERLKAHNPLDEVEIVVHPTVRYTGSMTNASLLGALQQLRLQENAPPDHYYYAVARPCDAGPSFSGVAQIGGPTRDAANRRVGWGVYHNSRGATASTFVHEIGHMQGRLHVHCSGDEAGVDVTYPHSGGAARSWGIDVYDSGLKVHPPESTDYMTYCSNKWVSEWGYGLVMPWIQTMSSWDFQAEAPKQRLLVGNLYADGRQEWYTTQGYAPQPEKGAPKLRVEGAAGTVRELDGVRVRWEESDDINVIVALPDGVDLSHGATWIDDVAALPIDPARLEHIAPKPWQSTIDTALIRRR